VTLHLASAAWAPELAPAPKGGWEAWRNPRIEPPTHVDPILSVNDWAGNSEMVLDMVRLGYLGENLVTLDPTWGKGNWWNVWRPRTLIAHDLFVLDAIDFRALPEPDDFYDAAVLDVPYVSTGGRKTSTVKPFLGSFGLVTAPKSPAEVQEQLEAGLAEVSRVTGPGRFVLVKLMGYVSSGHFYPAIHLTAAAGQAMGLKLHDEFVHLSGTGPQPTRNPDGSPRRQHHGRANSSTLLVFKTPGRKRKRRSKLVIPIAPFPSTAELAAELDDPTPAALAA
jgi:hypothetical protein